MRYRRIGRLNGGRIAWALGAAALGVVVSCSRPTQLRGQASPLGAAGDTVPTGFGSLRRDDIMLRFATDQIELQLLPLDEMVIRLLATDTYRSLEQLLERQHAGIAAAAERARLSTPTLVLVTFFALAPGARFTPDNVQLLSRGRLYTPQGIVPLSPTWNTLQLDQRQQAVAIYLYEGGVSWYEDLSATYPGSSAASWSHAVQVLQQERARVRARAQSQPNQPNP